MSNHWLSKAAITAMHCRFIAYAKIIYITTIPQKMEGESGVIPV